MKAMTKILMIPAVALALGSLPVGAWDSYPPPVPTVSSRTGYTAHVGNAKEVRGTTPDYRYRAMYEFSWGDGSPNTVEAALGYYNECTTYHAWRSPGVYPVRCRVCIAYFSTLHNYWLPVSDWSGWSAPRSFTVVPASPKEPLLEP